MPRWSSVFAVKDRQTGERKGIGETASKLSQKRDGSNCRNTLERKIKVPG